MAAKIGPVPKLISIVLLLAITAAIVLILRNPISGTELSIYSSLYPSALILITVPVIGGIGLVIWGLYQNNNSWQLGLFLIIISSLVVVTLPYLKGYQFSDGGDHLTHLGFIKDILNTSNFGFNNIYPVTHVLTAQLSIILNISPEILINFMGPLFYILFILFIYVCTKAILSKRVAILATTASTILFCYYYNEIFPMGFALIFLPLIFFLYFRNLDERSARVTVLLVILVILMVFFHPVVAFLLTIALFLLESGGFIYNKFLIKKKPPAYFTVGLPILSFYGLIFWIWYHFSVWNSAISSVIGWFNSELLVQPLTTIAQESFNKLGLSYLQQALLIIKTYGHMLIFLGLSLAAILLLIRGKIIPEKKDNRDIVAYSCFFIPAVAIWLFDYIRPLTSLTSGRMIWVVITVLPVLTAVALNRLTGTAVVDKAKITNSQFTLIKSAGAGFIIAICSLIGIFSLYPSPYLYQPYPGVSHASFNGEAWLVEKGDPSISVISFYVPSTDRISNALYGTNAANYPATDKTVIEDHFGYNLNQAMGEIMTEDKYLFLTTSNKMLYTELWPQIGKLNSDDFSRLAQDPSVSVIYTNGKAQNYYIRSPLN